RRLPENARVAFIGDQKSGPFDIDGHTARRMLDTPNPDGRSNADVVRPWVNGDDVTSRPRGMWIIDFGVGMAREEAALYEAPYEHGLRHVMPARENTGSAGREPRWWIHVWPRPEMRAALSGLGRQLVTPIVAKHRLFAWLPTETLADHQLVVFARDDDYAFGVLHSRVHELWARGMGTQLREVESGFRYTPTTCFETFPFPRPTDAQRDASGAAAARLNELREGWLNPPGVPDAELAKRTLTNLYNARPTWLANAHATLDAAVLDAYGWPADLPDAGILERLLDLNLERAAAERRR
ncbi:MAG: type IIL restriction-modification enzyme MmeI, partial [Chloroflexota bacterium]